MPCWVAIALLMESTTGWRHTESTGRYPKTIRTPPRSITSAKAVKRSIGELRATSRGQFPSVASGIDRANNRARENHADQRPNASEGVEPHFRELEPAQRVAAADRAPSTSSVSARIAPFRCFAPVEDPEHQNGAPSYGYWRA